MEIGADILLRISQEFGCFRNRYLLPCIGCGTTHSGHETRKKKRAATQATNILIFHRTRPSRLITPSLPLECSSHRTCYEQTFPNRKGRVADDTFCTESKRIELPVYSSAVTSTSSFPGHGRPGGLQLRSIPVSMLADSQ